MADAKQLAVVVNQKLEAIDAKAEQDAEKIQYLAQEAKDWAILYGFHTEKAVHKLDEKALRAHVESELDRLFVATHELLIKMGRSNPYTVGPQHLHAVIAMLELSKGDANSKASKIQQNSLRWPIRRIVRSRRFGKTRFASASWKVLHAWIETLLV